LAFSAVYRKNTKNGIHNITIPNHEELAKGTLNSILSSVSKWNNISKDKLIEMIK
jgi:methyl coenzyme M reductase subunit C